MKFGHYLAIVAAACMFAVTASAEEGEERERGMRHKMPAFEDVDTNADGSIVAEEFYAMQAKRMAERAKEGVKMRNAANRCTFEEIDTDADGKVSPDEFALHHAERRHRHRHQDQ